MVEMAGVEPASLYRSIVYVVTSLSCFFMLLQTQHSISFICLRILSELQLVNMNNFFCFLQMSSSHSFICVPDARGSLCYSSQLTRNTLASNNLAGCDLLRRIEAVKQTIYKFRFGTYISLGLVKEPAHSYLQ